jgi:hypothetical protein
MPGEQKTKVFKSQRLEFYMVKNPGSALQIGPKKDVVKVLPQTGKRKDLLRDAARKARLPGKRLSKTGNVYWETRKNRSDLRAFGAEAKRTKTANI